MEDFGGKMEDFGERMNRYWLEIKIFCPKRN
jgi:hypothetical protein